MRTWPEKSFHPESEISYFYELFIDNFYQGKYGIKVVIIKEIIIFFFSIRV